MLAAFAWTPLFAQTYTSSSNGVYYSNPFAWVINIVFIGLGIWVAVDASKYPDWVWQSTGQNKVLWQILPIVIGLCCGCFGLIPVLIYFLNIKKKLDAAQGGGYGGGYPPQQGYGQPGYPPQGGYGQPGYPPAGGQAYPQDSGAPGVPEWPQQQYPPDSGGQPPSGEWPPPQPQ